MDSNVILFFCVAIYMIIRIYTQQTKIQINLKAKTEAENAFPAINRKRYFCSPGK